MASNKPGQSNNVKVMVKLRPLIGREIESNEKICWEKVSDNEIVELDATTPSKPCIYDHVFGGADSTQSLYEMAISQIVDSCVQGFNGSVMAYGQTASGKTYTMMGNDKNKGIIRLVAENIFDIVEKHDDRDIYMVRCSFLEIYNEKINDLLAPEKTNLEVFETQDGAVMIKEATEKVVRKATNVLDLIEQGNATKRMGETAMNDRSSRSHTIFRIMIESQEQHEEGSSIKMGILDLVDLAGSESVNKTNATGDRLKEGISINKSLLELGRVIKELSEKKEGEDKFIVFRNSKLTRVIQHSLGGNAKSVVICTVSPAEREETRNTLRFASRAKNVKNTPKLNEILSDQAMIKRLNQKITGLRKQIAEMARQSAGVGHTAESMRQDIIDRIERCEMQFIRSKKASRKQNLRRQTWHCLGNENQDSRQEMEEFEQDSLRALMPPPPPIFTTQRGTHATHHHETFEMPNLMDEQFEPGENMSFTQSPSPKRVCNRIQTPVIFRRRLSAIIEGVPSPDVGKIITTCEK
ncbi:uncharacterized protein LOC134836311 [Culicoides brevitarsis]|uniref:uncharacterized protein LOC134836311 n=2 Tax=Culicoides brevitarsis TaxID=469753 RepID=UPI00307C269C